MVMTAQVLDTKHSSTYSRVPEGYKQTEVGVIPVDWECDFIKNLATISTGFRNTQDRIKNGIYPFFVRSQTIERINSYSFDGEAILTAGDGVGTGKVFHYVNGKFDAHQRVYQIANFTERLNGYFFFLYFSAHFHNRIMQMTAKSSVDSVRMDMIADMCIPLPPTKAEQNLIAEALSDIDALILSIDTLVAKKHHIKQGAMQELFRPKEGWAEKKLGEIAEIRDGTHQTPKYMESGIPFYSVEHVTSGDFSNTKFISLEEHRFLTRSFKIEKGDILMTRIGSIGECKLVDWDVDASFYVSLALLKLKKGFLPEFICQYSKSDGFQNEVELNSLPSATPKKINLGPISDICIAIPLDTSEQTRIATILSDMDLEIKALEEKLAKFRHIKQGMMAELLTGRIRLV